MDRDQYGPQRSQPQKVMCCKFHLYDFMEKAQQYTEIRGYRKVRDMGNWTTKES